jgi:hypothetical protein
MQPRQRDYPFNARAGRTLGIAIIMFIVYVQEKILAALALDLNKPVAGVP